MTVFLNREYTIKNLDGKLANWSNCSFVKVMDKLFLEREDYDHEEDCCSYRYACEHCLGDLGDWMNEKGMINHEGTYADVGWYRGYHWERSEEEQKQLWEDFNNERETS